MDTTMCTQLADALGKGALPALVELDLTANQIGDQGMAAIADSLGKGALPALVELELSGNSIGDQGMAAFADALGKGGLPFLKKVSVDSKHVRHPQLVAACEPRGIEIVEVWD